MISKTERTGEAAFSLLEVILCVGLLLLGSAVALSVLPALVRASQQDLVRAAATDVARNTMERVRAAVAYYPTAGGAGDVAQTADHAWAFAPGFTSTANVAAHVHRAFCGRAQTTTDVPLSVTTSYDRAADTVRVVVSYPRNVCDASVRDSVALSARLASSQWYPQTTLTTPINDPAQQ